MKKVLIEEHHTLFTEVYPTWSVIPKMHYMLHYPEQLIALGPLVRTWTMRCEGKLCLLKTAGRISNFKNITQTIAQRHQHLMCYELSGGLFASSIECGPTRLKKQLHSELTSVKEQISGFVQGISEESVICYVSWKVNGITYKHHACVLYAIENTQSLEPTFCFGCIEDLLVIGSSFVMFLVTVLRSQSYDDHFHAYNVTRSSQQILILQSNLVDQTPLHYRETGGELYISLMNWRPQIECWWSIG